MIQQQERRSASTKVFQGENPAGHKEHKGSSHKCKKHLDDPQDLWGLMRQQQQVYIGHKMKAALQKKNIIPAVRHVAV